jgi:hypothetical protein
MKHQRADYQRFQDPERKIPQDEPVFLLRGQDKVAGDAVRAWADLNERNGGDRELSRLAREQAARMDAWPMKKLADQ